MMETKALVLVLDDQWIGNFEDATEHELVALNNQIVGIIQNRMAARFEAEVAALRGTV